MGRDWLRPLLPHRRRTGRSVPMRPQEGHEGGTAPHGSTGPLAAVRALLLPPLPALAALTGAAAAGLWWVFGCGNRDEPASYAIFVLSAYALVAVVASTARARPIARVRERMENSPLLVSVLLDAQRRSRLAFFFASALRVLFAAANAAMGVYAGSLWNITLTAYYLLLALVRAVVVRELRAPVSGRLSRPRRVQVLCGCFLILSIFTLAGIGALALRHEGGFAYPGTLVYAVAAYAFAALISSAVGFVRVKGRDDPVRKAMNAVRLEEALVSMLSLEIAMLTLFGDPGDEAFFTVMVAGSGLAVALIIFAMGLGLLVRGAR